MRNRHTRITVNLLAVATLSACSPVATYPIDSRAHTLNTIVYEPVPTLMAESIDFACTTYDPDGDPAFNLPAGTTMQLYDRVIAHLGNGHPQVSPDEPAISITKVRSRGFEGSVDLFIPTIDGSYSFATLTFHRNPFAPFRHTSTRWWNLGEQPPAINHIALEQNTRPDPEEVPIAQPVLAHD